MKAQHLQTAQTAANKLQLPPIDKSKLISLSVAEKEKYVDELTITYPKINDVIDILEDCRNSRMTSEQPECASILGPSGAGKSTITKEFKKLYPDYEGDEGIVKPILRSKVPCPAHIGSLITKLLYDLGDPFYSKRDTTGKATHRLYDLLKKCMVQLIVIDEVQHLVDRDRKTLIKESSDWFKDLIDDTGIPVAFIGLPESEKIFCENEQLGRRVLNRSIVEPFEYGGKGFRAFLHVFDSYLPFEDYSGLSKPDVWQRIYLATDGYAGFIKALLKRATKIAATHNLNYINFPVLAQAYKEKLEFQGPNPFSPDFNLDSAIERLIRRRGI